MATLLVDGVSYTTISAALAASASSTDVILVSINLSNDTVFLDKNVAEIRTDSDNTWDGQGNSGTLAIGNGVTQEIVIKGFSNIDHSANNGETLQFYNIGSGGKIRFEECTITRTSTSNRNIAESTVTQSNFLEFNRCRFIGTVNSNTSLALFNQVSAANSVTIKNCIFRDVRAGHFALKQDHQSATNIINVYNCTFHNNDTGMQVNGRGTYTNNIFTNNTDDVAILNSANEADFTYCAFEQAGEVFTGAGIITGITSTDEYVDEASNNFHLKSGAQSRNAGTTIGSVTTDYAGTARPQESVYDIGAYEFMVGAGIAQGSFLPLLT